ncbi:MAG: flagellar basal body-associated FliL family protein, partial [Paracoccaceae bacterium]
MAETSAATTQVDVTKQKPVGKGALLLGFAVAVAGGIGGYYLVQTGLIPTAGQKETEKEQSAKIDGTRQMAPSMSSKMSLDEISFIPLDPIHITILDGETQRQLRFKAQVEVPVEAVSDVEKLKPRITDVLNSYLRAIEASNLDDALALTR